MGLKDKGEGLLESAADKVEDIQRVWDTADKKKRTRIRIALAVTIVVLMVTISRCVG